MKYTISTKKAADIFNVNVSTIKRWSDNGILKCHKTAGGHRKFSIEDIKIHAEELNLVISDFLILNSSVNLVKDISDRKTAKLIKALERLLLKGDSKKAEHFLYHLYLNNLSIQEIFDNIVSPCMKNIGLKWLDNLLKIEDEHIASKALIDALYSFEKNITSIKSNGKKAICVCIENEFHEIGILCVKITLEHLGWKVIYPGSDLPIKSLSDLIKKIKPDLVCLSVKGNYMKNKVSEIIELSVKNKIMIVNGGNPDLKSVKGIVYCASIGDLIYELKNNFK